MPQTSAHWYHASICFYLLFISVSLCLSPSLVYICQLVPFVVSLFRLIFALSLQCCVVFVDS